MNLSYAPLPATSRFARSARGVVHRTTAHGGFTLCKRNTTNMEASNADARFWNSVVCQEVKQCRACQRAFEKSAVPKKGKK